MIGSPTMGPDPSRAREAGHPAPQEDEGNACLPADRIRTLIAPARRILLISHVDPDGDAIGSLLALGALLRAQGKDVTLACQDPVPELYAWLPGSSAIVQRSAGTYDLVISLDCGDRQRMGSVYDGDLALVPLLDVDHHVTNTRFGTVSWVDPLSVATAQMVLTLADSFGWEVTQDVAVCLLAGLVTDTRGFRTPNVDAAALSAAQRLAESGAPLGEVARRTLDLRPLASVRLWGEAFDRLTLEGDVLWTEVTQAMVQRWPSGDDGTTGLSNFLSGVREARVVAVFTEREDGTVDVGLRAVPGCDVAQVALRLGGGGHPQAAGCTRPGSLPQVRELVLAEVRRSLAEQACTACHSSPAQEQC